MRLLGETISREVLPRVRQPAQYCGLEINQRCPDVTRAEVRVALAFPDAYTVGISHVGSQVLYTLLNGLAGVACDRSYCPLPDAEGVMRERGVPLFAWESRAALADFDVVGFSVSYELLGTNVLTMLDLAGIPLHWAERGEGDPIVVGGDAMADNPEPLADFFDLFLVGDGEGPLAALVELVRRMKRAGATRQAMLLEAARTIPEAYVPRYWQPQWNDDGTLASLEPTGPELPRQVQRSCIPLSESPPLRAPLVPAAEAVFDRISLEIMRGCPNSCRFCHAGFTRKPIRWRSVDELVALAEQAVANTGSREISLLSLSSSDYPQLGELMRRMNETFAPRQISIAMPSLRVDKQLEHLPWQLNQVRKGGLTIAAEVGSDRLRQAIAKRVTHEDLVNGVRAAYAAGWKSVKVYFMAGFPGETDADVDSIVALCRRISLARREVDGHPGAVTASVSWLVPKPHTPLQWAARPEPGYFHRVRIRLRELAKRSPVNVKCHHVERSTLEAAIARGDRRIGLAIEAAWRAGARFDGWDEHFRFDLWRQAFAEAGLDMEWYAARPRGLDEVLPWDPIASGRPKAALAEQWHEYHRVLEETPEQP